MITAAQAKLRLLLADKSGQAAVEYAVLAFMTVVSLYGMVIMVAIPGLEIAVFQSYQDTASVICLPIP